MAYSKEIKKKKNRLDDLKNGRDSYRREVFRAHSFQAAHGYGVIIRGPK